MRNVTIGILRNSIEAAIVFLCKIVAILDLLYN